MSAPGAFGPLWRFATIALSGLLGVFGAAGCGPGGRQPRTHTVTIEATSFTPDRLSVTAGDTVVWVNKDPFPHTATSAGVFDSGSIDTGKSWTYVAARKGTVDYICTFHPTMKARLSVE
jgi:plastocyanin